MLVNNNLGWASRMLWLNWVCSISWRVFDMHKVDCLQAVVCKDASKHVWVHVHTGLKCPIAKFAVACNYGRSHRSGWSGFNRTTFRKESNEYSITTTHLIACFACLQSICYLGMADTCGSSLWWQQRSLYRCSPMSSIPRQSSISQTIIWGIKTGVVLCAESLVQYLAISALRRRSRCCILPHEFSALLVLCLEFLHVLDIPESLSFLLCCCMWQCTTTRVISYEYSY